METLSENAEFLGVKIWSRKYGILVEIRWQLPDEWGMEGIETRFWQSFTDVLEGCVIGGLRTDMSLMLYKQEVKCALVYDENTSICWPFLMVFIRKIKK